MNIKGMIQKAKEKLFGGKEQKVEEKMVAQCTSDPNNYKNYKVNFAEIIAEGTFGVLISRISEVAQMFRPMEPWEREKLKIPNNERRRRKIPMVRSRAYIQARKNSRKRKKKKG